MKRINVFVALPALIYSVISLGATDTQAMSIFTTANWSNVQLVNKNNPSVVCAESGKIHSGTTLNFSNDQINSPKFKTCIVDDSFGVIFYGNLSGNAFAPQTIKSGDHCTASYSMLTGLKFDC